MEIIVATRAMTIVATETTTVAIIMTAIVTRKNWRCMKNMTVI